jgi:hypothetical protein
MQVSGMRFHIIFSGLAILGLGFAAPHLLDRSDALGFLNGALTLGGGMVICGIFAVKMHWHGIIGAGIVALLGAARGLGNLPRLAKFIAGERTHGATPLLELGVMLICLLLVLKIIRALSKERLRRMLESE